MGHYEDVDMYGMPFHDHDPLTENITKENVDDLQKALDWFKEINPEAYIVLLD
jgi:hypothetical protein